MIGFKVNGKWFDLYPNMEVDNTLINPIFDKENMQRVFSYTLRFPNSPQNNSILGHAHRLDTSTNKYLLVDYYINHQLYESGYLRINKVTAENISAVFSNELIITINRLKELKLRYLNLWQQVNFDSCPTRVFKWTFSTTIIGAIGIGINDENIEVLSLAPETLAAAINAKYPGIATQLSYNPNSAPGFAELRIQITCPDSSEPFYIDVTKPLEAAYRTGPNMEGTTNHTAEQVQLAWQDHLDAVHAAANTHVFPVVRNKQLYEDKNELYKGYINYVTPLGTYPQNDVQTVEKKWEYTLIPFPFVKTVLDAIATTEGSNWKGDWYDDPEMQQLLVWNNHTLDEVHKEMLTLADPNGGYFNTFKTKYNLADHLPDITAFELLQKLSSNFGVWFKYEKGQLYARYIKKQLSAPPIDWTNKTTPGYTKQPSERPGITLDYEQKENEIVRVGQLESLSILGNKNVAPLTYNLAFYSMHMTSEADSLIADAVRNWRIPFTKEKAWSTPMDMEEEMSLRLLYYRGYQKDSNNFGYPMADAGAENYAGGSTGNYSMQITGDKGLYKQHLQQQLELLRNADPVSRQMELNIEDILKIKTWENPRRYIYNQNGTMTGIIKSIKFKASMQGIKLATVEMIKE